MTTTLSPEPFPTPTPEDRPPKVRTRPSGARSLFDGAIVKRALLDSFVKLDPRTLARNRTLQLKLVGAATVLEPDASGRIGIPSSQRNTVGIDRRAVLVGMGDKFELWSEQAHQAQIRQTLTDEDMAGDDLEGLPL